MFKGNQSAVIGSFFIGGWLKYNSPRINAFENLGKYNVGKKHLPGSGGHWTKFSTSNQNYLRTIGKKAIKKTSMKKLVFNSADSYKIIYDTGKIIGVKGEKSIVLVFTKLGKIITFFPK